MLPFLKPEDRVIVSQVPYFFSKPKIKDIIVFEYNDKILIKRISKVSGENVNLEGDNKLDTLKFNSIPIARILGKVLIKV